MMLNEPADNSVIVAEETETVGWGVVGTEVVVVGTELVRIGGTVVRIVGTEFWVGGIFDRVGELLVRVGTTVIEGETNMGGIVDGREVKVGGNDNVVGSWVVGASVLPSS